MTLQFFFCLIAQSATSSTRLCQKGGVPLDVQGEGPTQRTLRAERESLDVQELPTDFKRHPKVKWLSLKISLILQFFIQRGTTLSS